MVTWRVFIQVNLKVVKKLPFGALAHIVFLLHKTDA